MWPAEQLGLISKSSLETMAEGNRDTLQGLSQGVSGLDLPLCKMTLAVWAGRAGRAMLGQRGQRWGCIHRPEERGCLQHQEGLAASSPMRSAFGSRWNP